MKQIYLAKQKIVNSKGREFANELLYRDSEHGVTRFKSNLHSTSNVIHAALTNIDLDELLGNNGVGFINIDEVVLTSGVVDLLDKKRFVLEILETTVLSESVIEQIIQYHKQGFKIAIDDFDCSRKMIRQFSSILKYVHIIKIDIQSVQFENMRKVLPKLKKMGIKLLAEKIETKDEYDTYVELGFDLYQGYYIQRPYIVKIERFKDVKSASIARLIQTIKANASVAEIEMCIKKNANLVFKLMKFLNNQKIHKGTIDSIPQVISLLGTQKLLMWLKMYSYSEFKNNPSSIAKMSIAKSRAENLEVLAKEEDKHKAYVAGMFSMIGPIFNKDVNDVMKGLSLDKDIEDLVVTRSGKFLSDFTKTQENEKSYLKKVMNDNFDRIDVSYIIDALDLSGVKIELSAS